VHGGTLPDNVGNHPNTYFAESVKYFQEKAGAGNDKNKQLLIKSNTNSPQQKATQGVTKMIVDKKPPITADVAI